MNTKAIIFDLDDTLIDTRRRHFKIVEDYINSFEKTIGFHEYLKLRKVNGWSNKQIIKHLSLDEDEFSKFWKLNIEDPLYLKHDVEITDVALLKEIKIKGPFDYILMSLRSNPFAAEQQLKHLSFSSLFERYLFLQHLEINPKIVQLKYFKELYQQLTFISDSQSDSDAADKAGVQFVGVQSGLYTLSCQNCFKDINSFLLNLTYV